MNALRTYLPLILVCLVVGLAIYLFSPKWRATLFSLGVPPAEWIRPSRARMVTLGIILLLVAPSLTAIAFRLDLFPYSNYPMYAGVVRRSDLEIVAAYGVIATPPHTELHLNRPELIDPFEQGRLRRVLSWAWREKKVTDADRHSLLEILHRRYERRRQAGLHAGPPLAGIRVYRVRWDLDEWARNRDSPTERELLYSYEP